MKKRIIILALIVTLVLLIVALVACARGGLCIEHKWEAYNIVDGNIQTEKCSICGVTRRLCYPFPHTYNSCVDNGDGTHTSHCCVCGIDEIKNHTFSGTTESVHNTVACDDCGGMFYFGTNHAFVDVDDNLTCDVCGESTGCKHEYDAVVTEPTCLQDGFTTFSCSLCGDSYITNIVASEGHSSETVVIREATCVSSGLVSHRCTEIGCGYSYTESINIDVEDGHLWVEYYNRMLLAEDKCNGSEVDAVCLLCDRRSTIIIESDVEHEYVYYAADSYAPTCYEEGYDCYECTKCGDFKYTKLDKTEHNYVEFPNIFNCMNEAYDQNYMAYVCTICDDWVDGPEIPAVPHTDDNADNVCDVCKVSLCDFCFDGEDTDHNCDGCNYFLEGYCYDDDADGLCDSCGLPMCGRYHIDNNWDSVCDFCFQGTCGHYDTYEWSDSENCLDGGLLYTSCSECGTVLDTRTPTEHMMSSYYFDEVYPTCTENGYYIIEHYCHNCYYCEYETQEIPATGHKYIPIEYVTPICSEGSVTYMCLGCGDKYTEEIPANSHNVRVLTVPATCVSDGCSREVCTDCGEIIRVFDIVPATTNHINDNADKLCDLCGASYCIEHEFVLSHDSKNHFEECVNCGVRSASSIELHIDTNNDHICDVCGACSHSFVVESFDELCHYKKCEYCGLTVVEGHNHELIETTDATCGDFGAEIYGCVDCDHTYKIATEEATGEHLNVEVYFNAEMHWSICTDCGIVFNESRHEMYYEDESYNGCFAAHAYLWICYDSDCGYSYYDESDAYGCTEDYYWDEVCWDCGKCDSHYLGEEYDANNDGVCDICGFCISDHSFSTEPIEVKTPTCDSRYGYSKYECENCKYVLKKDYTQYLDTIINNKIEAGETDWSICRFDWHNYEAKEVVAPNCGYNGYTIFVCVDCGWETEGNYTATVGEHINEDENIWYCDFCGICLCENHVDEDEDYRCDICDSSTCEWHDTYYKSNHDYHWEYCMQCRRVVSDFIPHEESYDDESGEHNCPYCGHNYCESFIDVDGDNLCDRMGCGYSNCIAHTDENNDYHCDQCSISMCYEHVSDGNYYHYFYHFSHSQLCVNCGELFYDDECYDWDYDNYCDLCGDSTCGHYDYPDESGWYIDGRCDGCGVDMSTIEPDCLHENFNIVGHAGWYHYGFCEDCDKFIYAHHDYDEVLDEEKPIEGETCYKEMYFTYTCPCCGYVKKVVRVYADHKDEDEDYICDVCNNDC